MLVFLKDYSLSNIRAKLSGVYILNVLDIVLTLVLQSTGYFTEGNPIMAVFVQSTALAIAVKTALPAVIFILLYNRMKEATDAQLKKSNALIIAVLVLYALINMLHLIWLTMYLLIR